MGDNPKIERANMDGTNNIVLINTEIQMPSTLTIDPTEDIIYWADVAKGTIEMVNMDGSGRKKLLDIPNKSWGAISSLVVFEKEVFLTTPGNLGNKVPPGIFKCTRKEIKFNQTERSLSNCSMVVKGLKYYSSARAFGKNSQQIGKFLQESFSSKFPVSEKD